MIPELRNWFNGRFEQATYDAMIEDLNSSLDRTLGFRISESPLFLPSEVVTRLKVAARDIVQQIQQPGLLEQIENAVPEGLRIPNETAHTAFIQIDFGLSVNDSGEVIPQLIELQGFPSLYGFQYVLNQKLREHFEIPADLSSYFHNLNGESYLEMLREVILGDSDPENVVLLERLPESQTTRIDFYCMRHLLGIPTVCVTDLRVRGGHLYYLSGPSEIPVERIYNRVIFDKETAADCSACFADDVNITWVGHPNWFFKLSKYSLPFLTGPHTPDCHFLHELTEWPADLDRYVLKPLFSFAGGGVDIDPTAEKLDAISDPENYILQSKVDYAPLLKGPDSYSKVEVRLMYVWDKEPILANNLVRLSQGRMMGVNYNRDRTWVGSSIAYHP